MFYVVLVPKFSNSINFTGPRMTGFGIFFVESVIYGCRTEENKWAKNAWGMV